MKVIKTLLAIFIAFAFTSCQKDYNPVDDPTAPATSSKVKTYTEDLESGGEHTTMTFNIDYDANNKMISMTSTTSPGDRFEFHYSDGRFTRDLYNSNTLSIHEDFFLNSFSLIDSSFQYNDTHDSMTEKYIYNAAKQLITLKEYDYSLVTGAVLWNTSNYVYDSRGNVKSLTDDNTVTTYDYYPNLVNNLVFFGLPDLPVSTDLIKTTTFFDGTDTITFNYVYTFDAAKRIISEKVTTDNGYIATKTYTYY